MEKSNTPPKSFEELLENWGPRIRVAIRAFGFYDCDEDDIYQDLISEFWERDYLGAYNPTRAAFSTYLYGFVNVRLLGYNRRRRNEHARNIDLEIAEFIGSYDSFSYDLQEVVDALSKAPVRGHRDLLRLFIDIERQIREYGRKNQSDLAKEYGISPAALSMQMQDLRDYLIKAGLVYVFENGDVVWANAK